VAKSFSVNGLFDLTHPVRRQHPLWHPAVGPLSASGLDGEPGTETVDIGVARTAMYRQRCAHEYNYETGVSDVLQAITSTLLRG